MKVETNINIYLHGRYLHGSEKGGQLQSIVTLCVSLKREIHFVSKHLGTKVPVIPD